MFSYFGIGWLLSWFMFDLVLVVFIFWLLLFGCLVCVCLFVWWWFGLGNSFGVSVVCCMDLFMLYVCLLVGLFVFACLYVLLAGVVWCCWNFVFGYFGVFNFIVDVWCWNLNGGCLLFIRDLFVSLGWCFGACLICLLFCLLIVLYILFDCFVVAWFGVVRLVASLLG